MTKLEMVRAILNPKTAAQERYAKMVADSHKKEDIAIYYNQTLAKRKAASGEQ